MDPTTGSDSLFIRKVLIVIGLVVFSLLILIGLYFTFDVLLLVFAAVLIAIFLRGIAGILGRFIKIREVWLVLIASLLLILALAGAIAGLAPSVAEQMGHMREELPRSIEAARQYMLQFGWGRVIIEELPDLQSVWDSMTATGLLTRMGGIFTQTLGAVGNFLIVILLAIYFAVEPRFYAGGFAKLFPIAGRPRVTDILARIGETLRWWLIGKAGSMLFIGVLTWIALSILGVPLALTLGLIAGLLSFIPNFGPIMSAVPAVLIAFIESPITALYVIGVYVGVQLVESNIVTPLIERETVELPPGLTVVFQLALAVLVGGLGLVLATPLLAVLMVLVEKVYVEDILGDRETEVKEKISEDDVQKVSDEILKVADNIGEEDAEAS